MNVPASKHGIYATGRTALNIRARKVGRLVRRMRIAMPWIEDSDLPAAKSWAEFEILGATVFAALVSGGVVNAKGEPKALLNAHRQIRTAQLAYERELGMTPRARAELRSGGRPIPVDAIDLDAAAQRVERVVGRDETPAE